MSPCSLPNAISMTTGRLLPHAWVSESLCQRQAPLQTSAPLAPGLTCCSALLLFHLGKSHFSKRTLGSLRAETRPHGSFCLQQVLQEWLLTVLPIKSQSSTLFGKCCILVPLGELEPEGTSRTGIDDIFWKGKAHVLRTAEVAIRSCQKDRVQFRETY